MKKSVLSFALLFVVTLAFAASQPPVLVITTKDQVQHEFRLSDKAQVTFEGSSLVVTAPNLSSTYPLTDVLRFNYKDVAPSGIETLRDDDAQIDYENGTLVLTHLKRNATVGIYDAAGKLVRQLKAGRAGTYRISLEQLPLGVYVVKAGTTTFKIARR